MKKIINEINLKMRTRILKYVLFSIMICFFEYTQNELYFINERSIYFERNIINFRNNRKLADPDNQFDLDNFYESALDFANAFNDYNDDDDEEMACLLNMIDSHVNKNKENNTIFNLNNVSEETKKIIYELQKELEEAKKELDNIRNAKLEIQPIQDKKTTEQDEYNYISEHEDIKQLENEGIKQLENEDIKQLEIEGIKQLEIEGIKQLENEGIKQLENEGDFLEIKDDNFEDEYYEIISSNNYKKLKVNQKLIEAGRKCIMASLTYIVSCFMYMSAGWGCFTIMHVPYIFSIFIKWYKFIRLELKKKQYA
ncbi:fam-b protein [Plasmodium vinckei lentum]|uniref:Fam-b protein n=1 Tax=Plasmodium vinckei lentum TaxID=138297 RepID=A0A6V7RW43_PLAVN|nr:fam-b protein [Plasmodium vinckei lentum]